MGTETSKGDTRTLDAIELAMDIPAKLAETDVAINYLASQSIDIPAEAIELRTIMRRCVAAESERDEAREQLGEMVKAIEYLEFNTRPDGCHADAGVNIAINKLLNQYKGA